MKSLEGLFTETSLWIEISITSLALVIFYLILRKGGKYLGKKFAWIHLVFLPIAISLFGCGTLFILHKLSIHFGWNIENHMLYFKKVLAVVVLTALLIGYVKSVLSHLAKRAKDMGVAKGKFSAIGKLCFLLIYLASGLIIFQIFGLSVGPILTFGGIGVAALALASQDILSNFFGGIMIFLKHPFYEGDAIVVPSVSNFRGTVSEVGLYATILEDENKRYSYFPNSLFCKSLIVNLSRQNQSIVLGRVALKPSTSPDLIFLLKAFRAELGDQTTISIDETIFESDEIVFRFTLVFEKMPQGALIEKKADIFNFISELVTPYEGRINLTS